MSLLSFQVFAEEPSSIIRTEDLGILTTSTDFTPILFVVDRYHVAQAFDPPKLPKVGDCIQWVVYQVDEDKLIGTFSVKMRLRYVTC